MSQNDFTLANQSFPAFRADLNSALQALATNSSGGSAPSTTFANMWWYDTSNNIMYIRNEDNDAWIKFAELDQANDKFVLSGTLQLDDGTVSAPALTFNSDTNMGIYRGGTDILKFVTAGTDAITINANQDVTLASDLTIQGNYVPIGDGTSTVQLVLLANTTGNSTLDFGDSADGNIGRIEYEHTNDAMTFRTNNSQRMCITSVGNVGIGTSSPTNTLQVTGNIYASTTIRGNGGNSASSPNIAVDGGTGMFKPTGNTLAFSTASTTQMTITSVSYTHLTLPTKRIV